jgi:hypothetical protein
MTEQPNSNHQDREWPPLGEDPSGKQWLLMLPRVSLAELLPKMLFVPWIGTIVCIKLLVT